VASESPGEPESTAVPLEEPTAKPTDEQVLPTEVPTDVLESTEEVFPTESPTEGPVLADGETLLQERCTICHDLVRVTGAKKDRAGWEQTVDRMIGRGAQLNEAERVVLINYLTETYRP
jgi:cytochrome c5